MGAGSAVPTTFEFYGGLCMVIAAGEITRLTRIANGDTVIWSGNVDQTSRDSDGKTALATSLGTAYLYWGRDDEQPNAQLAAALVDYGTGATTVPIPAWRHWAKLIFPEASLGTQPTPPTLKFDFERRLDLLAISAHEINGDAVLPEVIYDLLTNAVYSVGADISMIDEDSFVAACETIIDEGLGASPQLDDTTTLRDFIGTLLEYIDGALRWENGRVKFKLLRKGDSTPIAIDESALTDEPTVSNQSLSDTWNFTRLVFTDRDNNWDDDAVEAYDDQANAGARGENVANDVELPFVTKRAVAKILARKKGLLGGIPQATYTLRLMPSFGSLRPGDLISFSYGKLGLTNKILRVSSRRSDGSRNRDVEVEAYTEILRDDSHDYTPPDDPIFNLGSYYQRDGGTFGNLADTEVRLLGLPSGLLVGSDGFFPVTYPDGCLVAFGRPNDSITRRQVWRSWDPNQAPYHRIDDGGGRFATETVLRGWMRTSNNTSWTLRIEFAAQDEADYITGLIDNGKNVYFITAWRKYKSTGTAINQHQPFGVWCQALTTGRYTPVDTLIYDIEVTDGAFSSPEFSLETAAANGVYPCEVLYCGRLADFVISQFSHFAFSRPLGNGQRFWSHGELTSRDTDLIRWFKVRFGTPKEMESLDDATATTFDRDDTTMCPDGTLSEKWGPRVPALYEAFDLAGFANAFGITTEYDDIIADLDEAEYAEVFGLSTVDQDFIVEGLEAVLAFMVQTGIPYYNNTL